MHKTPLTLEKQFAMVTTQTKIPPDLFAHVNTADQILGDAIHLTRIHEITLDQALKLLELERLEMIAYATATAKG